MYDRPYLDCPDCGEPLFPTSGRGRTDVHGNFVEHPDACRCRWCDWVWWETIEPTACDCGARCTVEVDENRAYVHLVAVEVPDGAES